ncbi:XRE family transcriptional regulator [Rothia dentocariosa]|uniref:XRE family transcriptional regulator n=1 Tax=Rothia dentocariosa TaxID=2047 RepID=UPI003C6DF34F
MSNTATYTATEAVAREIRGLLAKAGLTQKDVANILAITQAGVSDRLRGKQNFSLDELFTLAGALDLTVGDLLGDSIVSARVPEPSYIEGQGRNKRKVAPIGFVPNGATYQILSGEECALWGSNPRPAD